MSLSTLSGRVAVRMLPGERQHSMLVDPDSTIGGAEVVFLDNTYDLHLTQTREAPPVREAADVLGVDLGLSNVATDSAGQRFTGEDIRKKRSRVLELARVGYRSRASYGIPETHFQAYPPGSNGWPIRPRPRLCSPA